MILDEEKVKELIESGVSEYITDCREYSDELNMHITGKDVDKYTELFNDHESPAQKKVRERLLKSNKGVFSFLTRPLDKVFTAKGGSIVYNLPEAQVETIEDVVSDVSDGLNLKTYLKKKVKPIYLIDPNGFVMLDLDEDGGIETSLYRTHEIHWYSKKGNKLEAVIFNPIENDDKEDDKKYYRVLDENTDSIWVQDGNEIYQQEDSVLENYFGYVPGHVLGDVICPNTGKFLSLVDDVLEDAKEHLRDISVNVVHKLSHGFAKYWQYPEACTTCGGDGVLKNVDENDAIVESVCYTCQGGGVKDHKDASDLMLIDIPQDGEQKITPEVGGYINPSIEVWRQYKEDIFDLKSNMFQSLWGTTFQTEVGNETATGRLLNVQPEAERVASISKTFSDIHEFILDAYGRVILGRKDYKSNVSYGTRYLMESPDEILDRYTMSKEKGLPATLQQDLLERFYQAEYANNNQEYRKTIKIINVDPFPGLNPAEVKALGITGNELNKKIYYPQWVNQLTEAKKLLMTPDELKKDLEVYVNNLNIGIDATQVQQGTNQPIQE